MWVDLIGCVDLIDLVDRGSQGFSNTIGITLMRQFVSWQWAFEFSCDRRGFTSFPLLSLRVVPPRPVATGVQ